MLHGLGATGGLNWSGSQHFLGDRFRLVTVDHRGHGRGIRTRRFRLEDCADDAAACIDALGIGPAIVVGYSMGGPIAALLWRRHPDLVAGLVFCATSRNFGGQPGQKITFGVLDAAGRVPVPLPGSLIRGAGSIIGAIPLPQRGPVRDLQWAHDLRWAHDLQWAHDLRWAIQEMAGHDPRSLVQAGAALGRFDSSGWIGLIDVPASVVVTTRDQLVPPDRQIRLARSIPGATWHGVDAGHLCIGGGGAKERFLSTLRDVCGQVAGA
jgi:pimeloyl-ACP methyl ester carboxylesterase